MDINEITIQNEETCVNKVFPFVTYFIKNVETDKTVKSKPVINKKSKIIDYCFFINKCNM